eukprot:scaffold62_cov256-Pinguiococcus_pyrenoidosus.AAC.34
MRRGARWGGGSGGGFGAAEIARRECESVKRRRFKEASNVNGAVQGRTCHSDVSETCPSDTSEGHVRMTCLRHVNLTHYSRLVRTDIRIHPIFTRPAAPASIGACGVDSDDEDYLAATGGQQGTAPVAACGPLTCEQVVREEIRRFRLHAAMIVDGKQLDRFDIVTFWKKTTEFPNLRRVAKDVLAIPASSAAIERDFCLAGDYRRSKRASMGGKIFEAMMFIRQDMASVPIATDISVVDACAEDRLPEAVEDDSEEVELLEGGDTLAPDAESEDEDELFFYESEEVFEDEEDGPLVCSFSRVRKRRETCQGTVEVEKGKGGWDW